MLAIDLYNLAFEGGPRPVLEVIKEHPSSCGLNAWNAIKPIQELMVAVRSKGVPVIYTTSEDRKDARPKAARSTYRKKQNISDDAHEICNEFKPEPDDLIIYKQRASGFFGTPLISHLTQLKIDSLIVCGHTGVQLFPNPCQVPRETG